MRSACSTWINFIISHYFQESSKRLTFKELRIGGALDNDTLVECM